jgi:hypothetical protein
MSIREKANTKDRAARRRDAVARAAAAGTAPGGVSDVEAESRRKFLTLVAGIVVAGILMVAYTWSERQYDHPTTLDSWQNAYAVFDCQTETWQPPFGSRNNPDGIRSRGDGIIYIEPGTDAVAGNNATLGVFLEAVGAELTDDTLTMPDGTVFEERGTFCGTEPAILQVLQWPANATEPDARRLEDLASTTFRADRESLVIMFAPPNAKVPLPPAAADLPPAGVEPLAGA